MYQEKDIWKLESKQSDDGCDQDKDEDEDEEDMHDENKDERSDAGEDIQKPNPRIYK